MADWRKTQESSHTINFESDERLWTEVSPNPKEGPPAMTAFIKWDGCSHVWFHALTGEPDYVHTDDLPQLILQLQALVEEGKAKFGPNWPNDP